MAMVFKDHQSGTGTSSENMQKKILLKETWEDLLNWMILRKTEMASWKLFQHFEVINEIQSKEIFKVSEI